ncbi:outer membrane beta-barrel protein [Brumimicrobium mesophilum]|uniref:outer membrane beta-barrel protein n=1 Tax=Brumimicrobium mesophilum TaxID=392717 RepID=UPI000D141DB8|nr:outer membrane beta-barrel protein [Brumimicrobium mesophilum]
MKKISILLLLSIFVFTAKAQTGPQMAMGNLKVNWYKIGWFLDANAGGRFLGQTSDIADMSAGPSFNAGLGYFFNDKIALKGRLDYNQFSASYGNVTDRSGSIAGSAEVMVRLLQVFANKRARDFSLNLHAGAGLTALRNPSYKDFLESKYDDYKGKLFPADNMGHIIVGITPQYHFNSRLSINLDISQFSQFKQHKTYDKHNYVDTKSVTGIVSTTIGLTFRP